MTDFASWKLIAIVVKNTCLVAFHNSTRCARDCFQLICRNENMKHLSSSNAINDFNPRDLLPKSSGRPRQRFSSGDAFSKSAVLVDQPFECQLSVGRRGCKENSCLEFLNTDEQIFWRGFLQQCHTSSKCHGEKNQTSKSKGECNRWTSNKNV